MAEESILKLQADLAWILALVWIAKAGRSGEPQPQVHYYLGDRYWRLSERYKEKGSIRRAQFLRTKAERHLRASGWDPLPPAAAMAMLIPKRPTFTEAIGWRTHPYPPDDAA
jgi:hypothetical protein